MSEILLSHYKAMLHVSMHTIETITDFGWTVFSYFPCCYDLPSLDFHYWYLKDKDIITTDDVALQNYVHQWLQNKEFNFFLAGIHALVQRWKKVVVKCVNCVEK
jgi:hypothetical protein